VSDRISAREFARRDRCDEKLVRRAIAEGRLERGADGKLDAAAVGTAWRQGNVTGAPPPAVDATPAVETQARARTLSAGVREGAPAPAPTAATASGAGTPARDPTYAQAMAKKEHFIAEKHELEFLRRRGELVDLELARRVLFDEARRGRDHWLNWPARVAATIAAELGAEPDRVAEILTTHVTRHLEFLASPDGSEFDPA
jgi:hypothetical protein